MAQDFSKGFYNSKAWKETSKAYKEYRHHLCEECLSEGKYNQGEIVHHKIELTPQNINNPLISLDWNNLELVCRECHAIKHGAKAKRRYKIDATGNILIK